VSVAAVVVAAPAHADTTSDIAMWTMVHNVYGLDISHDDAIAQGLAVCLVLEKPHVTFANVALQVMDMHPDWTATDAAHFAGSATGAYCPD
jgi:hypothetical protein